jgi:hypothetical protein
MAFTYSFKSFAIKILHNNQSVGWSGRAIGSDSSPEPEFKADDTISISTRPAPWDQISLSREDDPMTPTDMRHFNVSTNEMLLTALLCKLDEIWQDGK